eukprot:10551084-Heterocapsa_arctica.AAC.1
MLHSGAVSCLSVEPTCRVIDTTCTAAKNTPLRRGLVSASWGGCSSPIAFASNLPPPVREVSLKGQRLFRQQRLAPTMGRRRATELPE